MELIISKSKVKHLLGAITEVEGEISRTGTEIETVLRFYENKYPDLMRVLLDINLSIQTATSAKTVALSKKSGELSKEVPKTKPNKVEDAGCRGIFKKIAKECHPDINGEDSKKTEVFLKAKEFLNNGNYTGLLNLLNSLGSLLELDALLGETEIDSLNNTLLQKKKELMGLKSSLAYRLKSYSGEESSCGRADILFCNLMTDEMNKKYSELKALERELKEIERTL